MKLNILIAFGAIILSACAPSSDAPPERVDAPAPRPTPSRPATVGAPPTVQATLPAASNPTAASPFALYNDKAAPFTVQYPRDWKIREEPESIFFTSPDDVASLHVITYEYQDSAPRNVTAKDVLDSFTQNLSPGTGVKLTQPVTHADGSISASIEFVETSTRIPHQGILRVALAQSRRYHFILLFSADRDQWTRYQPMVTTVLESFRER